ncbi:MAG: peptidylprolyl isomerase [Bdellovibrio sp.]|nr:peptidylprolyl isomerase [Bdellovibrio sp.]
MEKFQKKTENLSFFSGLRKKMKARSHDLTSFFLFLAPVFFATRAEAVTELARINERIITLEEFNSKYQDNLRFFQMKQPSRRKVLDDLIKRELGVQEAKRQGLDKDPEIQARINTVLYHALLEKALNKELSSIQVSEADAKEFYLRYPVIRTSHIFVGLKKDASADAVKAAYKKIKLIEQGPLKKFSFSEVAQKFSEGPAAPMGGDVDYQSSDKLDPYYYEAALNLKVPGAISGIVRTPFGLHIIQLTGIRPWEQTDHAEAKRRLFEHRRTEVLEKYMAQLHAKSRIAVRFDLLKD